MTGNKHIGSTLDAFLREEGCLNEIQRIAELEAEIEKLRAALEKIAGLPTREANGVRDGASVDVLTGGEAINLARKALSGEPK
jgi:hypothetical protein